MCKFCNFVKAGFPRDTAILILDHLRQAQWRLNLEGFVVPKSKVATPDVKTADSVLIEGWIDARLAQEPDRRPVSLWPHLVFLVTACHVGNGNYQDPSGAIFPLELAELDRLDSADGYSEGNMRLILGALNRGKMTSRDDRKWSPWLEGLKTHGDLEEVARVRAPEDSSRGEA